MSWCCGTHGIGLAGSICCCPHLLKVVLCDPHLWLGLHHMPDTLAVLIGWPIVFFSSGGHTLFCRVTPLVELS